MERCEPQYCLAYEQVYLDYYQPWLETGKGYNICKIAGSNLGRKFSNETRNRMKISHIGKIVSNGTRQKMSQNHNNVNGPNNPMFNKKHSKNTIEKIKQSRKRKPIERINLKTGLIKEYASIKEAGRDGFDERCIIFCCTERQSFHKGYFWKYLNEI